MEKDNECGAVGAQPVITKMPLTILTATAAHPDGSGSTTMTTTGTKNCVDMLVTAGEICESAFHDLNDHGADSNFCGFAATTAGCYEFEIQQREFILAAAAAASSAKNKEKNNEFVGVSSLDILQGVGRGI